MCNAHALALKDIGALALALALTFALVKLKMLFLLWVENVIQLLLL